ncbi:zinc ribbon domain-containing protein [Streptomyces sp. R35]|uniref:Zinc ribbon domain-containing protein n=1 Tax=Streptomyces sp. R35 TaxID=3238630 RepID=A0AB39S8F4_9ACTN
MSRKLALGEGEAARIACARGVLRTGVEEKTGGVVPAGVLAERVGWAADLVSGMVAALLAEHWNTTDVDVLARGEDAGGRTLPSNAWMALRRLGWTVSPAEGIKVNDRIVRMAQEAAGRTLRAAKWRADLTAGVLATWPADPSKRTPQEWDQVREAVPGGRSLPSGGIKARTRQITSFVTKHGRMPIDVFEAEAAPRSARALPLSACDRQQATLRIDQGRVRADLAHTHAVPTTQRSGHTVALGVDWGLNTLLSAGAARLHDDGRITALGSGAMFRAAGALAKQHRLRRQGEHLHTKADLPHARLRSRGGTPIQRLINGVEEHALTGRHAVLDDEVRAVGARRSNLNAALAWSAARWAVDQAVTAGASVIYVEDLRSMEARGMGRTLNTRLSQQIRGQIVDRMRHLAAEAGIAVVTVPARNTSRHCPQCLVPLRHRKAPDRPTTPGWKWALCGSCGRQGDRDQGAWRRIAARGLTHQTKTVTDRTSGTMTIRTVTDTLEAGAAITPTAPKAGRDRSKTGPTRQHAARPTPRRRRTPSPTRPPGPAGRRPEGHAHTDRHRLPRAAHRHQGVTTISTPTRGRHRPRGAALGAGFHHHAHATPPQWAEPVPGTTPDTGSLS